MKDGLRAPSALLGESPPFGVPLSRGSVSEHPFADEIDVDIVFVGRPMALEIVKERRPIPLQTVLVEIVQRKREGVIYAD